MAALYVVEYAGQARDTSGYHIPCGQEPNLAEQKLAIGVASVPSAAFHERTRMILAHADVACSVAIGADPTATANHQRLGIGESRYFGVTPGHKIAVIVNV